MEKKNAWNHIRNEAPLWLFTLLATYIITALMLLLLAFLVYQFHLGEKVVDIAIIGVYVLVNFLAGFFMGKKLEEISVEVVFDELAQRMG